VVVEPRYGWRTGRWYRGWGPSGFAWWWGVNGAYYRYSEPVYPYPAEPVAPVEQQPVQQPPVWYYCRSQNGYYPTVPSCPEQWEQVESQPEAQ
jgi:hypothetical protein